MSKTKKFILTCIVLIVSGLFLCGFGYLLGGRFMGIGVGSNGIDVYSFNEKNTEYHYKEKEQSLENFNNMDVNIAYADLSIVVSDHYGIAYKVLEDSPFSCDIENGTLKVSQSYRNASSEASFNLFYFGTSGTDYSAIETQYVTIYVPAGARFDSIVIHNESGKTSVEDLKAGSLSLQNNYGSASLRGISTPELSVNLESGALTLEDIQTDSLTVKDNYGDVKCRNLKVSNTSDFILESGDLILLDTVLPQLTVNCSYGAFDADNATLENASIKLESGRCDIRRSGFDSLTIDSSYGDVNLNVLSEITDYAYELSTDYGDISIGSHDVGTKYSNFTESHDKEIKINCESGDITIKQNK